MKALKGFTNTDWTIMAIMFLHAVCAILTGTVLVGIIAEFNISYTQAGLIDTIRNLSVIFVLVITVKLLKIFSAKQLFIFSRVAIAAGYIISAITQDYTLFLVGVVIAGMGVGFVESLIAQTITNLHAKEDNIEKFFNFLQSVFSIAVIIVPLAYGYAMTQGVSWRSLFLVTSVLPLIVAAIIYFSNMPEVEPEEGGYVEAIKNVFTNKPGRLFAMGIIIAGGLENMFYFWSATYISTYLNDNQQYATTGLAIFGAFMFLARFLNGVLPGKKVVYYMMFMACVAGVASSALLYFFSDLTAFYVALACAGLAVGPLWPSITGLIADHVEAPKAGYFIIIAIMGIAGYAVVPALTGFIGDATNNLKNGFILLPLAIGVMLYVIVQLKKLACKNGSYYK